MFIVSHMRKSNMGAHSFSIISNSANCFTAKLPSPYPPARFSPWKCMIRNANVRQIKNTLSGSSRLQLEFDRGLYQDSKAASILSLEDSSKIFQLKEYQNAYVSSHVDEDIVKVRRLFSENESRQTSVSAYDTAWVAMVPSLENSKLPQFPQCLSLVMDNQLGDGSWGLSDLPYIKDRLSHTLACIIALRTWNVGNKNVEMGLRFIRENIGKIAREDQYNPIGFDIIFSAMLEDARSLCLELSYDSPPIKLILTRRKEILNSIAIDDMNEYDSPLIYSIEGIRRIVDWNKVLTHQNKDGSLFHSPSATACALMHTGKPSFLKYLSSMLQNLGNGVPSVYPINIFASLSMVDRLERLGIARHFKSEIKQTLDDVYRWWTQNEIIEGRSSPSDIVNSSMSFKILRCNGYDVSPDAFLGCLKDGDFLPSVEKSGQAVTAMLNLYRASQVMFPDERILGEVKSFSRNSLSKRQANGTLHDQNMVMKDLAGEVEYALSIPWLASLERIEHRSYIEQYGVDDIWVGKTSYRIPCISNELFLTLAKKDYNLCQEIQQKELQELEKWYEDGKFGDLNFARQKLLYSYFSIASTLFSPEMSAVRMVWTKNSALITLIDDFYDVEGSIEELQVFVEAVKRWDPTVIHGSSDSVQILFSGLYSTVNDIAQNACALQGRDVSTHFKEIWYRVVSSMMEEAEWAKTGYVPSMQEYIENGIVSMALEPNVVLPIYFVGPKLSEQIMQLPEHSNLLQLLSTFGRLLNDTRTYPKEAKEGKHNSVTLYMKKNPLTSAEDAIAEIRKIIDESAHKLLKIVVQPSGVPRECKELYWYMLRALQLFYLNIDGVTSPTEILQYVNSVIFYPVL